MEREEEEEPLILFQSFSLNAHEEREKDHQEKARERRKRELIKKQMGGWCCGLSTVLFGFLLFILIPWVVPMISEPYSLTLSCNNSTNTTTAIIISYPTKVFLQPISLYSSTFTGQLFITGEINKGEIINCSLHMDQTSRVHSSSLVYSFVSPSPSPLPSPSPSPTLGIGLCVEVSGGGGGRGRGRV